MKPLNFNTDSWHYYIAKNFAHYDPRCDNADICTYLRHVLGGSALLCLLFLLGTIFAFALINMLFGIGFSLFYGHWIFTEIGEIMLMIVTLFSLGILGYIIFTRIGEYRNNKNEAYQDAIRAGTIPKPVDGFVKNAYKSWKQKYCVQIAFSDEDGRMVGQQDDDF